MMFNNCKTVRLVSAESQRVIPCSASTTKGIILEDTITAVSFYEPCWAHTSSDGH